MEGLCVTRTQDRAGSPPGPSPHPGTSIPTVQPASFLLPLSFSPLSSRAFLSPVWGVERCPHGPGIRGPAGHGAARGRGWQCRRTPGHQGTEGRGPPARRALPGGAAQTLPGGGVRVPGPAGEEGRFGKAAVGRGVCRNAGRPASFPRRDRGRWQLGAENTGEALMDDPLLGIWGDAASSGSQAPALCQLCAAGALP